MKKLLYLATILVATILSTGCTDNLIDESTSSTNSTLESKVVSEQTSLQNIVIGDNGPSGTRSSFTGTFPSTGGIVTFHWTAGDALWVKSSSGMPTKATATDLSNDSTIASFQFLGVKNLSQYPIYYVGSNYDSNDKECYHTVNMATLQYQILPNDSRHITFDGDCGITRYNDTRSNSAAPVNFTLNHRSTYFCFLPYNLALNETNGQTKLTKVVVETTDGSNIAGTYILGADSTLTQSSGNSSKITLSLGTATSPGFPIFNTTNQSLNASYMVIAPGTHALKITYRLLLANNTTAEIVQNISSRFFKPNTVYSILKDVTNHSVGYGYHLWDAKLNVWVYGNTQFPGDNVTKYSTTGYWYNPILTVTGSSPYYAQNLDANDPTASQTYRYVNSDSIYWDSTTPWVVDGRAGKGGIWLKKGQFVKDFGVTIDLSKNVNTINGKIAFIDAKPEASKINRFFFLPAAGYFGTGSTSSSTPTDFGVAGYYQVKTARMENYMYYLRFIGGTSPAIAFITHTDTREKMAMLNWVAQ